MKNLPVLLALALLGSAHISEAGEAEDLADRVIKASGGDAWPRVKSIEFTFNVAQGDKVLMSAKHHWDIAANTDTVTVNGASTTAELHPYLGMTFSVSVFGRPNAAQEMADEYKR